MTLPIRCRFVQGVLVGALLSASGCIWTDDLDGFEFSEVLWCADEELEVEVPIAGSTEGRDDAFSGSCGGAGSPEVVYQFTAPADDYYRFTTTGSAFDTVLYLHADECGGDEVTCNDDAGALQTSEVFRSMTSGERIMVVVDGKSDRGALSLLTSRVSCPSIQLGDGNLPIDHTLVGQSDDHAGGVCGGDGFGDRAYRFTAPEDGLYRFELTTDTVDFVGAIYLEEGPACDGERLGCNSGQPRLSHIARQLSAGEDVTLRVDGNGSEGGFALDVHRLADSTCIDGDHGLAQYTLTKGGSHRMTTSCAGTAHWPSGAVDPADIVEYPDLNLRIPRPTANCGALVVTAQFPFAAALLEGECAGVELDCVVDADPGPDPMNPDYVAWLSLPSYTEAWESVTLVVDRIRKASFEENPSDSDEFTVEFNACVM